jgi:hypothetical protein
MKLVSTLAFSAVLAAGFVAAPAAAQQGAKAKPAAPAAAARKFNVSKEARNAIAALQTAVRAHAPDVPQKLAAAQAVAKNSEDKYIIAKLQLEHALFTKEEAAQRAAVEAILASGGADADETGKLNEYLAAQSANSGNPAAAEAFYTQRIAANPNDISSIVNLAAAKLTLKKDAEALPLLQKAISLSKAAGQPAQESWYRNAVGIADKQKNYAVANELANEALRLYPNKENFNNLVAVTQPLIAKDQEAFVDFLRLMQTTGQIKNSTDYYRLAQHHEYQRNWGGAKSALEAAAKAGKSTPAHSTLLSKVTARIAEDRAALPGAEAKARAGTNGVLAVSIANVYAGYGDYTKAVDLYRLALQKGGVDANLVNTRLGMALAMGGQRAEAETIFRKVTGLRAPLANLWLAWLAQSA